MTEHDAPWWKRGDREHAIHRIGEWVRGIEYEAMINETTGSTPGSVLYAACLRKAAASVRLDVETLRVAGLIEELRRQPPQTEP